MTIEITHVRYSGYNKTHEAITHYKWTSGSNTDQSSKADLVAWVGAASNEAYVGKGSARSKVGVVRPASTPAYLRTVADGVWSNNLLSLPTF